MSSGTNRNKKGDRTQRVQLIL